MDDRTGRRRSSTARVLDVALIVMIGGAISMIAMQAVRRDWFPADVSISQYGVGAHGWMLTMTLLLLATASALTLWAAHRLGAARTWPVILPWAVWILACVVMAFVPTNEWPEPLSLTGQVHHAAAVCGLFAAPIGAVLMVGLGSRGSAHRSGGRARTVVLTTAPMSWVFLGLLVLTNVDIDVTGLGYQGSWSLHQTVAVVLDIIMMFALIICLRARANVDPGPGSGTTSATSTTSRSVPA